MAGKRKFKSDAFEAIHSSASAMYKVGAIDKTTMREFDASCLTLGTGIEAGTDQEIAAASSHQPASIRPLP